MFKKMATTLMLFAGSVSIATAGSIYVAPTLMYQNTYTDDIRYEEVSPKLALGYSTVSQQWIYLAGELFGSVKGHTLTNHPKNGQNLRINYSMGMSLIPGLMLDPYLIGYVRLGLVYSRFDQADVMRNAYQVGAGMQFNVNPSWDIRAEYDYMQYSRISNLGSPRAGEVSVSGIYRFADV